MLTTEKCKKLLEKNGNTYKEEEVISIRDFLSGILEAQLSILNINSEQDEKSGIDGQSVKR